MRGPHRVLLGVTGGIAAVKAPLVASALVQSGAEVDVILTRGAEAFVKPLAFSALTGRPVYRATDLFQPDGAIRHIELARQAEAGVVAPATASFLARLADGEASDLLVATLMGMNGPVILAPAMEEAMWVHPAVRGNVDRLTAWGYRMIGPVSGRLASGAVGTGRMAEPASIVSAILGVLRPHDLEGRRFLVTAGPTREYLDDVRFISNGSSGRMGWALAEAARDRGAEVVLVSGPVSLSDPTGVTVHRVVSASEMAAQVKRLFDAADTFVAAAAVADARPAERRQGKAEKAAIGSDLALLPNEDILAWAGAHKGSKRLVGFALQSGMDLDRARTKLLGKALDLIVVNDATEPGAAFGSPSNHVVILDGDGPVAEAQGPKETVAHAILDALEGRRV